MNRLGRVAAAVGLTAALVGCGTAAQQQYQAIATSSQAINGGFRECVTAIYAAPEAAPLRPRLPLDAGSLSLAQLADTSLATDQEIQAIVLLHPRYQQCQRAALDGLMKSTPSMVPILATAFSRLDDSTLTLMQRRVTWGEFSRRRRDLALAETAAVQAEAQRIAGALERSHDAEIARRQAAMQAASAALARAGQSFQAIGRMHQPVMTNCFQTPGAFGNSLSCTTY